MASACNLRDIEPFNLLSAAELDLLEAASELRSYPPQTPIFHQHDPPTGYLYVIREGMVEIVAPTPGGIDMVVDYRREGTFFGGTPVFSSGAYTAGARTVRRTTCYLVPQEILSEITVHHPEVTEYFTSAIFSRVRSLYAEMVGDHSQKLINQMEAYPFQRRLSQIMSTPVEICAPDTSIREVARQMARRDIGSVVVSEDGQHPVGIITERDLVAKVLAQEGSELDRLTAGAVMSENPWSMSPEAYMYEATTFVMRHRIKHLPIVDDGVIVGMVTLKDLMRYRSQKSMLLIGSVKEAATIEELVTVRRQLVQVAASLLSETRSAFESMEILSYIHHHLLQRAFEITLAQMADEGLRPPDIRYCFIIMGSGGRKEMLLGPDQDNGLVFEDYPEELEKEVDAFFIPFAERLVAAFEQIGYPRCNGGVMASNPFWRGRLRDWKKKIAGWMSKPEPKQVMYSTIFLDFYPLAGDPSLCQVLHATVHQQLKRNPRFLYFLLENELQSRPPLNMLGRFAVEKEGDHRGKLSLKQAGSVFIVDCIRMFLLEKGVDAITTLERLEKLVEMKIFTPETAEHIKAALEAFTFLRLRNEIALIQEGGSPSHYIDPAQLSENEQDLLREAFRAAARLQDSTKRHFGRGIIA